MRLIRTLGVVLAAWTLTTCTGLVEVPTREGIVGGFQADRDSPVIHFYGIPYAEPPVGKWK